MNSPPRGGKPSHDNPGGHAYLGLRALAKRHGRTSAEYLRLYALEGFLLRLESSRHREDLILKGGASRCTEMFRLVSRSRRLLNMAVMRHSPCYASPQQLHCGDYPQGSAHRYRATELPHK